jgi:outer membrane protein OmpA-like peptidoglycan-associated protein
MRNIKLIDLLLVALVAGLITVVPSFAQEKENSTTQSTTAQDDQPAKSSASANVESGKKQKVSGIIIKRDGEKLVIKDRGKAEINVNVTGATKIEEKKKNPFRSAKVYDTSALVRGLWVEVEGRGSGSSSIDAEKIKFTEEEYRDSASLESRVDPVEDRVSETETRLTASEQNAQRLAGQIDELTAVANTARGGAKAAQETADKAIAEIGVTNQKLAQTNDRLNSVDERVNNLDDYEPKNSVSITFKVNRATLSDEAKTQLDELANQAKNEKGYVIQVAGFASADGPQNYNRQLSERRANAVVRYLIENHDISQRRIITPFGFGELKPAGDNTTREGREQNRRVEVAILVSKGMVSSAGGNSADNQRARTTSVPQQQ